MPALAEMDPAAEIAGKHDGRPAGLLRLAVSSIAEGFLSGELMASFLTANPGVRLDVLVTDAEFDIVEAGFDAGSATNSGRSSLRHRPMLRRRECRFIRAN